MIVYLTGVAILMAVVQHHQTERRYRSMVPASYRLNLHLEDETSLDVTVEGDTVRAETLAPSRTLRHKLAFYVGDTVVRISERAVGLSQLLAKDENEDLRFIGSSLLRPETRETLENMALELHVIPRIRIVLSKGRHGPIAGSPQLIRGEIISLVIVDADGEIIETLYTGRIVTTFPSTAPR